MVVAPLRSSRSARPSARLSPPSISAQCRSPPSPTTLHYDDPVPEKLPGAMDSSPYGVRRSHPGIGRRPLSGGWTSSLRAMAVEVGQRALADLVSLVGRQAEHAQQVLGDPVGGLGVVALAVVVQQLPEDQRGTGNDHHR